MDDRSTRRALLTFCGVSGDDSEPPGEWAIGSDSARRSSGDMARDVADSLGIVEIGDGSLEGGRGDHGKVRGLMTGVNLLGRAVAVVFLPLDVLWQPEQLRSTQITI